jgi:DNA polymerase III delta subunit
MDIAQLKEDLLNNIIKPTYIFTGEELALQDIYVDKICEVAKMEKVVLDNLASVYNRLGAKTIVKVPPKVYVVRDDELYYRDEKVWDKVINGTNQGKNIIILKYTNPDKRGKFYKQHESICTEFNKVGAPLLSNRVQALTGWNLEYCKRLVNMCQCNYGRIKNEIENIRTLSKATNKSMDESYLTALKSKLIHEDIGDIIFDFTNAIVERNVARAYSLLEQIRKTDEGPVKLISVLYNSFRNVMIVQSTPQNQRTEQILGLPKGQIYVTSLKCDKYDIYEVVYIVKLLQSLESGIKTGEVDQSIAVDYLLGEIF